MKHFALMIMVIFELAAIGFLAGKIYLDRSMVLGADISINHISKKDVVFPKTDADSNLINFYEYKPNIDITHREDWLPADYTYTATTVNSDGLNERLDYFVEKGPDEFRIVALGDSFTFGVYVDTEDNYPERLEDMLNNDSLCNSRKKLEVINLGVGGYDIEYSVHRFKVRGQKYNPDLVLWLIKNDDFRVINELVRHKIDQYRKEISSDSALLSEFRRKGILRPWNDRAVQELMTVLDEQGMLEYSKKALSRMRENYKGRLIFIVFSGAKALDDSKFFALQSFAKERNDTYIYDGLSSSYEKFADSHPTSKGYEKIASEIFKYISINRLVPCD